MAESPTNSLSNILSRRMRAVFEDNSDERFGRDQTPHRKGLVITFCILSSAVLWFMFSMQETYTQFFEFPISLQNVPPEQALTGLPPETVRVQIQGQGVQLLRLYYNPPVIALDAGSSPIDLAVAVAEVTASVRMESITPAHVELQLEPRISRHLPIRSRVQLNMTTSYHILGQYLLTPDSVTVSGASSIVSKLEYWPTVPDIIEDVRSSTRFVVLLSDSLSGLVELEVESTEYSANIQPFTEATRQVEIKVDGAPAGREITFVPASTSVTFQVPLQQYDRALAATDFYASVAFDEIRTDTTGIVYPRIHLPDGIVIRETRISPDAFGYFFNLPERQ